MSHLDDGTIVTDLYAHDENARLTAWGYTIRCIETMRFLGEMVSTIWWDAPEITEANLPY